MSVRSVVRYGSYPAVMALVLLGVAATPARSYALPWLAGLAASGLLAVALLERRFPFDARWQASDQDFPADVAHAIVNLAVMHAAVLGFVHPVTHELLRFETALPPDMAALETLLAGL